MGVSPKKLESVPQKKWGRTSKNIMYILNINKLKISNNLIK